MFSNTCKTNRINRCYRGLGTYIKLHLRGPQTSDALLDITQQVINELKRIELLLSFHNPNSELSKINRTAHLYPIEISKDLAMVINTALQLSHASNGLFDATSPVKPLTHHHQLPNFHYHQHPLASWKDIVLDRHTIFFKKQLQIDLGGIAKGYAVDQGINICPSSVELIINAGGDLRMTHWHTQHTHVQYKKNHTHYLLKVPMKNAAIATSSHYYTDHASANIISPHQQSFTPYKQSISIFAPTCMIADALTKILWLSLKESHILHRYNATGLLVNHAGKITTIT